MSLQQNEHLIKTNTIPGIESYIDDLDNPTIRSPYSCFELPLYKTRESLMDTEIYKRFLDNAITRFRRSVTYSNYKGFLIGLGLDRCQVHGNINNEMATLEMHHNILTIFDIALIITEHTLNTRGKICTFDLVQMLKEEHKAHRVQLTMVSLTPHQLYHNADGMFFHTDQCIGDWVSFLNKYNTGLTLDIAFKVLYYIKDCINKGGSDDGSLLELRKQITDWSGLNV